MPRTDSKNRTCRQRFDHEFRELRRTSRRTNGRGFFTHIGNDPRHSNAYNAKRAAKLTPSAIGGCSRRYCDGPRGAMRDERIRGVKDALRDHLEGRTTLRASHVRNARAWLELFAKNPARPLANI